MFDIGTEKWSQIEPAPTNAPPSPRSGHICIAMSKHEMLVMGGVGDKGVL
jgi:hypothetical protein